MKKKSEKLIEKKPKGVPVPIGTEQETGLTRGETEDKHGPVKKLNKQRTPLHLIKRKLSSIEK